MENLHILGKGKTKYYGNILEQGVAGVKQKVEGKRLLQMGIDFLPKTHGNFKEL